MGPSWCVKGPERGSVGLKGGDGEGKGNANRGQGQVWQGPAGCSEEFGFYLKGDGDSLQRVKQRNKRIQFTF